MCIVIEIRGRICFTAGCDMLSPGDHQTYCHQYRRPLPPVLSPISVQHRHTASTPVRLQNALRPLFDELRELTRELANWHLCNEQAERLVQEQAQAQLRDDYLMQVMTLEQRAPRRGRNVMEHEAQIAIRDQNHRYTALTGTTTLEPTQCLINGMLQPWRSSSSAPDIIGILHTRSRQTPGVADQVEGGMIARQAARARRFTYNAPSTLRRSGGGGWQHR